MKGKGRGMNREGVCVVVREGGRSSSLAEGVVGEVTAALILSITELWAWGWTLNLQFPILSTR